MNSRNLIFLNFSASNHFSWIFIILNILTEGSVTRQFKGLSCDEMGHVNNESENSKIVFDDVRNVKVLIAAKTQEVLVVSVSSRIRWPDSRADSIVT
jgi:hypothetical protein